MAGLPDSSCDSDVGNRGACSVTPLNYFREAEPAAQGRATRSRLARCASIAFRNGAALGLESGFEKPWQERLQDAQAHAPEPGVADLEEAHALGPGNAEEAHLGLAPRLGGGKIEGARLDDL